MLPQQVVDGGIVPAAQRQKRYFVISGAIQPPPHEFQHLFRGALPHRTIEDARLAKTAALGAPPGDLQIEPIVNRLRVRNQGDRGIIHLIQEGHELPGDAGGKVRIRLVAEKTALRGVPPMRSQPVSRVHLENHPTSSSPE